MRLDPARRLGHRSASKIGRRPQKRVGPADAEHEIADDNTEESSRTAAAGRPRSCIERREDEKQTIANDIKDVYAELKGTGF